MRKDRSFNQMREISFEKNVNIHADGSCLVKFGNTHVLCLATIDEKVPHWLKNTGKGWVTAEYGMLPGSTSSRNRRESKVGKQTGGDVLANKNTLLSILAEMNSSDEQRTELKRLKNEKDPKSKIEGVKSIFDDLDIKSKCTEVMQSYYEKALQSFSEINTKNKNNALLELSNALMNRDF